MKKIILIVTVCITAAVLLMGIVVFARIGSTSEGYEAYKEAVKKTVATGNFTGDAVIQITDNDDERLDASVTFKTDWKSQRSSSTAILKTDKAELTAEFYELDGKAVMKNSDSDVYYVTYHRHDDHDAYMDEADRKGLRFAEKIADMTIGNIREHFAVQENTDGNRFVSMELQGREIPGMIDWIADSAAKEEYRRQYHPELETKEYLKYIERDLEVDLPELVEEVRLERIGIHAEIGDDDFIKNQTVEVVLAGKDETGKAHRLAFNISMRLYAYNETAPDTIDLTGKQIKIVEREEKTL